MPNKHIEHPEDAVFDGKREVLYNLATMLKSEGNISIKYDGAPAIVFGTNPDTNRFFVGTKSVFNKKKIKINYTYDDISKNHTGNVADILRLCLRYLPRDTAITQADWIGVGGSREYTPNTLTYRFANNIPSDIILAPHTSYDEVTPTAVGHCGHTLASTSNCHFVNTREARVGKRHQRILAARIAGLLPFMKVPQDQKARLHLRTLINSFIRQGLTLTAQKMYDAVDDKYKCEVNVNTFIVWQLMAQLKQRLLDSIIVNDTVECFIKDQPTQHEGFVIVSDRPLKLIDRNTFSRANFNLNKNWTNEKV